MDRKGVGVVVGRFQVAGLHDGHVTLICEAAKHRKLCIFIGVQPSQFGTRSDPLDYPTREQMMKEIYPQAQVYALMDRATHEGWSRYLDETLHALYPLDETTLYCGRDSFKDVYVGRHRVVEIDPVPNVSGTDLRDIDGATVENHASFRKGLIYSAYNRWPPIFPCVDIACVRTREGVREVLVGQRDDEGGAHRFPGGHVNPSDDTAELAAKRELHEETGVESGPMRYIGEYRVSSWRDRPAGGTIRTIFFWCDYIHGPARGADDLDGVKWVPVDRLGDLLWADSHKFLAERLLEVRGGA
jgi:bifunctional NMN adenylyltransferase/nudix hydrolase